MNDLGPALDSSRTAAEIAVLVDGSIEGAGDAAVRGIETVEHAVEGDLTFIGDARHARHWADSKASVALVTRELDLGDWDSTSRSVIRVEDADQAMIQMLELIESAAAELADHPAAGVHPDARVDPTATIADDATVGPFVVIGPRCRVGSDACIESGARIYADAVIGDGVHLHANVTIRERCVVGARSILHAGVVIGSDGFGYRPAPDGRGLRKIPHV
ncbi:MAG: UDP-3-O-(3-hydroxymyristoyl)glucosamine N-acyltransferase, partial [Phycisphaeraceae bacterium]|nr:UDP-3-O-(3-hydroxymyristoyl)glucosamine N-acyltransferase [Phycisphaeraceae bacterium]